VMMRFSVASSSSALMNTTAFVIDKKQR
jgi:hypothetical protein